MRLAPAPHAYFAVYDGEVVVLDVQLSRYRALGPRTSRAVQELLEQRSGQPRRGYEELRPLVRQGLLVPAPAGVGPVVLAGPAEPGGVVSYKWNPHKSPAVLSGKRGGVWNSSRAAWRLAAADRRLRRGGIGGLLGWLRGSFRASSSSPDDPHRNAEVLVVAHLRARMIYPRQVHCLVGSAALAAHAWAVGASVTFVIGVQKYPFVAHAWVEHRGQVLNDRPEVARRLARIVAIGGQEAR